ncbi:MAG: energy transducer TonB [Spirochaetaceae bacterium]|jgi:protein TonB|nr:energy transducer TonB [Spirochaetaceae bacterium]
MRSLNIVRLCVFLAIAGIHGALLFVTFHLNSSIAVEDDAPAQVMKLTNFDEALPPPIIPPRELPPPPREAPPVQPEVVESIADVMEATDEELPEVTVSSEVIQRSVPAVASVEDTYLPMHQISVPPVFSEQELRRRLVYPVIAQKSGIGGIVYLELFVDREGRVQNIVILKEDPKDRGFGEAAVKAFQGFQGTPAQANGTAVAVRYRYPLRFVVR